MAATTPLFDEETNPWTSAAMRFDQAAVRLRLDDGMCKVLKSAAREITVHIPVQLDDGRIEVFTDTAFSIPSPTALVRAASVTRRTCHSMKYARWLPA
jgi:hypothetical protein